MSSCAITKHKWERNVVSALAAREILGFGSHMLLGTGESKHEILIHGKLYFSSPAAPGTAPFI